MTNNPPLFWDLTIGEIIDLIKNNEEKRKEELKWQALLFYKNAEIIGVYIRGLFYKGVNIPSIYDAYPDLFEDERKMVEEAQRINQIEVYKAQFMHYALKHNKDRKERQK